MIAVTPLGLAVGSSGNSATVTLTQDVPAGASIVLAIAVVYEQPITESFGEFAVTVSDSVGNSYLRHEETTAGGLGSDPYPILYTAIYRCHNCSALSSGQSFTWTLTPGSGPGTFRGRCVAAVQVEYLYSLDEPSSLLTGLRAFWKLDEASGTREDSHGSNDLTDNNSTGSSGGLIGDASQHNSGSSQYLSRADNADLSITGDKSFMGAVRFDDISAERFFLVKWDAGANSREYYLSATSTGFTFAIDDDGTGGAHSDFVTKSVTVSTGVWYHYAATWNASTGEMTIRINAGTPATATKSPLGAFNGTAPFSIGCPYTTGGFNQHRGRCDETGVWDKVLSAAEISDHYNTGLLRAYPFLINRAWEPSGFFSREGWPFDYYPDFLPPEETQGAELNFPSDSPDGPVFGLVCWNADDVDFVQDNSTPSSSEWTELYALQSSDGSEPPVGDPDDLDCGMRLAYTVAGAGANVIYGGTLTLDPYPTDDGDSLGYNYCYLVAGYKTAPLGVSFDRGPDRRLVIARIASASGPLAVDRYDDALPEVVLASSTLESLDARSCCLRETRDGRWILTYTLAGVAKIRISRDQGATWSVATTIASGYHAATHDVDEAGGLLVVALYDASQRRWRYTVGSVDGSGNWSFSSIQTLVTSAKGAGELRRREDGVWEFLYVTLSDTATIVRCRSLKADGTGTWS